MVTVAELVARLRADVTGFVAPMAAAERQLKSVQDEATTLGVTGKAALGLLAGGADDVQTSGETMATSWELSMARIRAANDATIASFAKVALAAHAASNAGDSHLGVNTQLTMRPGSGFAGGGGVATDVGSMARAGASAASGIMTALLLVFPVINTIIAGVVALIGLLVSAAVAAAAFAAAFLGVGAAMAFAAYKWRDLLSTSTSGASSMKASLLAVEAAAFNAGKTLMASFSSASGGNFWNSLAQGAIALIQKMEPIFAKVIGWVVNFTNALQGVNGATSPFLDFLKTWLAEWKVLWGIINQGLPKGGGIFAFFAKYEAPAKAFAEGIALAINAIRKVSAAGLGLNMDQLAVFIKNLFTVLAAVLRIFPTFSNALVGVGLALSDLAVKMIPVIRASFQFGVFILSYVLQPLLTLATWFASNMITWLPFTKYLVAVAGGFVLVAVAVSKLSFGIKALSFKSIMTFGWNAFRMLSLEIAASIPLLSEMGTEMALFGAGALIVGALALAWFVLRGAMNEVAVAEARVAANSKLVMTDFFTQQKTGLQTLSALYAAQAAMYNSLSVGGRVVYGFKNAFSVLTGVSPTVISIGHAVDDMTKSMDAFGASATSAIAGGSMSLDQANGLKAMMALASSRPAVAADYGLTNLPLSIAQAAAQNKIIADAAVNVKTALSTLDKAYANGSINAGQYVTMLGQLGLATNAAGQKIDTYALTVQGAGDTIANALLGVQKNAQTASSTLNSFALASGQSFTQLKTTALTALNDIKQGLLGDGTKVNQFFQSQQDVITSWKTNFANSMNFVNAAFQSVVTTANVTFAQLKTAMLKGLAAQKQYNQDYATLIKDGASQALLLQVNAAGTAGAPGVHAMAQAGRQGVQQANHWVKMGGDMTTALAKNAAAAINLTMQSLVTAIELMMSKQLGVKLKDIQNQVQSALDKANGVAAKNPIKFHTQVVTPSAGALGHVMFGRTGTGTGVVGTPKSATAAVPITANMDQAKQAVQGFKNGVEGAAPIKAPFSVDTAAADTALTGFVKNATGSKPQPSLYLNTDPAHTSFVNWLTSVNGSVVNTTLIVHRKVTHHDGGPIMHAGGAVMGLRSDERSVVLQVGEFVMQRSAVNRVGLGTLAALNSGEGIQGLQSNAPGGQRMSVNVGLERRNFMRGLDTEFSSRGL